MSNPFRQARRCFRATELPAVRRRLQAEERARSERATECGVGRRAARRGAGRLFPARCLAAATDATRQRCRAGGLQIPRVPLCTRLRNAAMLQPREREKERGREREEERKRAREREGEGLRGPGAGCATHRTRSAGAGGLVADCTATTCAGPGWRPGAAFMEGLLPRQRRLITTREDHPPASERPPPSQAHTDPPGKRRPSASDKHIFRSGTGSWRPCLRRHVSCPQPAGACDARWQSAPRSNPLGNLPLVITSPRSAIFLVVCGT